MVSSPKVMLTVVWNTEVCHAVDVFPKRATFDTDHYCENILSEILTASPVSSNRRLVVHADNAKHTLSRTGEFMERNNLRRAPHLPFSPHLAPSDCLLFGYIKGKLEETGSTEKDDLLTQILELLIGISGKVLKAVFIEWEKRLQVCIDAGGEYVE
jgi:hypothetical protein